MLANDYSGVLEPRVVVFMVLTTMVVIALGVVVLRGLNVLNRQLTGWKGLARRFPVTAAHTFGEKCPAGGSFAHIRNRIPGFMIEFAPEGMLVTPDFAKTSPILVPWSAVGSVSEVAAFGRSDVVLYVKCEKPFRLHFPSEAIPVLQRYLPAERFRKEESLSDLLKDRMNQRE